VCNAASIAPRSCDELKSELEIYQQEGRGQKTGDTFATSSDFQTGVCTHQFECSGGTLCDLTTNLCSKCKSNADCAPLGASELCAPEGTCVECVVDSDCTLPTLSRCKPDEHRCVQCSTDADCPIYVPHCATSTGACGQ
jgi:hypothetical protein